MADFNGEGDYVPTDVLARRGVSAAGGLAGGAGLLILLVLPPVMGIAAGVIAAFAGAGAAFSRESEDDRRGGIFVALGGFLSVLARLPITRKFAAPLLALGAFALIGAGIWNGIKFLKGLKSRT